MDSELEQFKSSFVRQCKELMIEPAKSILDRISVSNLSAKNWGRYTLNLSAIPLSTKSCEVLSKLLVHDGTFSEINFNNCSITEGGLRALCLGLTDNITCRKLSIVGNSIRGEGASCLGRMIRNNLKLHSLHVDQNSLGLLDKDFVVFCEGIAGNRSLHVLDLRDNMVTGRGAQDLCEALASNDVLRCIDLRFNRIGLVGGRAILSMLKRNRTINRILLDGNDIPRDVLSAIEAIVAKNSISSCIASGHCTTDCGRDVRQVPRSRPIDFLLLDVPNKRYAFKEVNELSDILEERKRHVRNVGLELLQKNDDLLVSEERLKEAKKLMKEMKVGHEGEVDRIRQDFARDMQEHQLTERRLVREVTELTEKKYSLENRVGELELKDKMKEDRINEVLRTCTELEGKLKSRQAEFEEILFREKQKFKDTLNDVEVLKNKELDLVRKDRENAEASWKEDRRRLESERHKLETSMKDMRSEFERLKVKKEEEMESLRVAMRADEAQRRSTYEERLHEVERSRDDLRTTLTKVEGERSNMAVEVDLAKRSIAELQQEVVVKHKEKNEETSRVRSEVASRIKDLELEVRTRDAKLKDAHQEMQMLRARLKCLRELDVQHSTTLQLVAQNLVTREVAAARAS